METPSITATSPQELIIPQEVPQTPEGLARLFVAEQDIRNSSRGLYYRTLSLFFKWIIQQHPSEAFIDALGRLSIADLNKYKESLQERLSSKLSIGSYIVAVRRFYEWAEAKKWYPNIARGLKTPPRKNAYRKQHLSEEKSSELLKYFRTERKRQRTKRTKRPLSAEALSRDYAIVNLMLHTGLRTIEVIRADVGDITYKREQRVLNVFGKGRSDKEDFVVITEEAFKPLQEYLSKYRRNAKPGEPLFTSLSLQNKGQRLTTRTISDLCKEGLIKIGLYDMSTRNRPFTAHSLRHTTAVAILKAGGDLTEVQAVLRHNSIDTSKIYVKSIEEEMRLQKPAEYRVDNYFH